MTYLDTIQQIKQTFFRLPTTPFDAIKKLPDVVFFDYDGTISDNAEYLVKAFNYAIRKNLDKKTRKEIAKIKKDSEQWQYIKKHCKKEIFAKCNADYDVYLSKQNFRAMKNSYKLLRLLKKYEIPMYIVSQKSGQGLRDELAKNEIGKFFKSAFGTLDFGMAQKPTEEFTDAVLTKVRAKSKESWMIGDRNSDVLTALNFNGKAFIIDKSEANKIVETNGNLIGRKIFFASYNRLYKLVKILHRQQVKKEKEQAKAKK